jgi:hypothetical protein
MEWWSNGVVPRKFQFATSTPLLRYSYSYLSAATGSRREADQAGAKPENKPVRIETAILTRTRPSENWIGKEGNAWPMPVHIMYAKPSPMNPPSRHSEVDSIRN